MTIRVREARHDDYEAIAAFTQNTWPGRDGGDYIPRVYHDWLGDDDPQKHTVVAEVDGVVAGLAQTVLLSPWEAWNQGLRVNPDYRGRGVSTVITDDLFDWAREQGATVARNMVFSWNAPGLGQSRATGYDPVTEFRWAHPDPDPDAEPNPDAELRSNVEPNADAALASASAASAEFEITSNPDAAWRFWTDSAARDHFRGLALDDDESWAVSYLTREDLERAADAGDLLVVQADGTAGFAHRVREFEREGGENDGSDGETETWVEYGVGAWRDAASADALFAAIARHAADRGADRVRLPIPETVRAVSDAALCRVEVSDDPDFVLAADLTVE
ncbi:GNAT family N-acetyltransferase [Halorussus amylolyticus]|uniref:GNAT family N-acetyltransferase n=1 Tax=Halorussus amylolyticus TaxID=1126242 RepID=UPI00104520A3|nr:GNAT family N-acetyltransferase [Halorussus amylolyticus]